MFGSAAMSSSSNKLEFKAGRMTLIDSVQEGTKKKMVHADKRKGLVYIYSADDGLTHFCWKDRTSGNVEDDLIIFPDDCEFKKVDQCKDGRVFLLKFKSSNRKLFFWLQEPTNDKDDEYCRKVNELLNNPPSANNGSSGGSGSRQEGSDLQYMLNNMSQQQLMQLFGGVGQMGGLSSLLGSLNRPSSGSRNTTTTSASSTPSATRTTTASSGGTAVAQTPENTNQPATPRAPRKATNSGPTEAATPATGSNTEASRVLLSELQNYLAGISAGGSKQSSVDLSTSLNSDTINSILSDPELLKSLQDHLPNINETDDEKKPVDSNSVKQQLKETLASPQFQQALSMFSNALQSGQLGPVVSQFKLSDDAVLAANSGDLEQFVKALEKTSITDSKESDKNDEDDKKDESKN
ncbi:unnamed protein product [Chironomus riparius]|uniref:Proteasomal ubiquitin receptor ADRM1 homolog n=1 Tax=Chironomus riparius TaxID=315576 RepID=A0A9N9WTS1_9DIPT|nr:unnamed protein product [Chironomus riparius]